MYHRNISGTMIILAKTSQLFSADSLVGKSSYGSMALPPEEGLKGRPFAFAQGDIPHKCRGDILPTASGHMVAVGSPTRMSFSLVHVSFPRSLSSCKRGAGIHDRRGGSRTARKVSLRGVQRRSNLCHELSTMSHPSAEGRRSNLNYEL